MASEVQHGGGAPNFSYSGASFLGYTSLVFLCVYQFAWFGRKEVKKIWNTAFFRQLKYATANFVATLGNIMIIEHNPEAIAFLEQVRGDRGDEVAEVCIEVIAELKDEKEFSAHEVLRTALARLDAKTAQAGLLHLSKMRRCNSRSGQIKFL